MKHEQRSGTLRRLSELVTKNLGLKILAMAIAVLIYVILEPGARPEAQLESPFLQEPVVMQVATAPLPVMPPANLPKIQAPPPEQAVAPMPKNQKNQSSTTNNVPVRK